MNLPPALTWLQLFPSGTQCACATGPEWFGRMLQAHAGGRAPRTLAVWGKKWHEISDLPNWDGLAAVNCSGFSAAALRQAGFTYVRRFAVLPRLEKARWFISLDNGAAAAASFSVYTPARKSAHVKKAIAKLAARLRLPGWYREEIIIASRRTPPLERKLAELFGGQTFRLGLSAGAPEPAINRKASAAVIDERGAVLAFVKIAGSKVSRQIAEHEAEMLGALEERHRLQLAAPRLLFAGEVDGRYITVQTPLPGDAAPARLTPAHERFLASLHNGQIKPASATNMVATLPERLAALPKPNPELRAVLESLMPTLETAQVPSTIVHGDFAPWNLRAHRGQISAFDWEYGELDGLPLVDETHFTLQLGLEMEQWDLDRAARHLHACASVPRLGLEPEQVGAIQAIYLLDNLVRLFGEGYDEHHDMVALYRQLLSRLVTSREVAAGAAAGAGEVALA